MKYSQSVPSMASGGTRTFQTPRAPWTSGAAEKQILRCSLQPWTCSQVQVLPRQWMVGPRSDSRPWLGETPAGASSARTGPSWTEFVRPAHQAVGAFAGADMINRAEPRACGHSREPIPLDSEPEVERNAVSASNAAGDGGGRARSDQTGFQPSWGKPAGRKDKRGWRKRGQDLRAICHDARKGRNKGSHWSKPVAPPFHSTKPKCVADAAQQSQERPAEDLSRVSRGSFADGDGYTLGARRDAVRKLHPPGAFAMVHLQDETGIARRMIGGAV